MLPVQRRHGPRGPAGIARSDRRGAVLQGPASRPGGAGSTSCAATSATSTSGAPWTSRSSGCWCSERCGERRLRTSTIVVTQLMASGAGGGAQVHVQNLVERPRPRTLRHRGDLAVRRSGRPPHPRDAGHCVHVVDAADDGRALEAVSSRSCAHGRPTSCTTTCIALRSSARAPPWHWPSRGCPSRTSWARSIRAASGARRTGAPAKAHRRRWIG